MRRIASLRIGRALTRALIAAAALAAAGALSACEHVGGDVGTFFIDGALDDFQESLTDRDCAERYYADLASQARCDADDGW